MHEYLRDVEPGFSVSTTRGKLAEYDFTQPSKKKKTFVDSLKSGVPMLSDHYRNSKTHSNAALPTPQAFHKTFEHYQTKKGLDIGNLFHQSELQNRLNNGKVVKADKGTLGHLSFNKVDDKSFMFPKEDRFKALPAVSQGRNRMFYTSQIF